MKVSGVDVFHPNTGEVRSDGPDNIVCWFIDADYSGETSRPFDKPKSGRVAVKVINPLGGEVIKFFSCIKKDLFMSIKTNTWYTVRNQSLAVYARASGFDLAVYDQYSEEVQDELRKRSVKAAVSAIKDAYQDQGVDAANITCGIYVISLSNPLSIQYRNARSQVIYIGQGNIVNRIRLHFEDKLFDFMQSLSGANFDFHLAKPAHPGTKGYYKHVEHLMLKYFNDLYGGVNDGRKFPILNKNSGTDHDYKGGTEWWKKPLKAQGGKPKWELKPTDHSDFAPLD